MWVWGMTSQPGSRMGVPLQCSPGAAVERTEAMQLAGGAFIQRRRVRQEGDGARRWPYRAECFFFLTVATASEPWLARACPRAGGRFGCFLLSLCRVFFEIFFIFILEKYFCFLLFQEKWAQGEERGRPDDGWREGVSGAEEGAIR